MEEFSNTLVEGSVEIYNEFSLQHELGIYLRTKYPDKTVRFEKNVTGLFRKNSIFIKKEIDIIVCAKNSPQYELALELKFPTNGQYPEQIFQFCKDIKFAEQLVNSGFRQAAAVFFAQDKLFYSGGKKDGIYAYFRGTTPISGSIQKPTGNVGMEITLSGSYSICWNAIFERVMTRTAGRLSGF